MQKNGKVKFIVSASGDDQPEANITVVSRSLGDKNEPIDVIEGRAKAGSPITLEIPDARLWSPTTPWLYHYEVQLDDGAINTTLASVRLVGDAGPRPGSL